MVAGSGNHQAPERKPRRDKGRRFITERDLDVLPWIAEQYAIRLDQLQQLLGRNAQKTTLTQGAVSPTTAQRVVERWQAMDLVESEKFLVKNPAWVWLSRNGIRQLGLSYKYLRPSIATLEHTYWLNQVRLRIEGGPQAITWRSERSLRAERQPEPYHYADAEVVRADGMIIGVEVELTRKRSARVTETLEVLAQRYEAIWYFTNPQTRATVENGLNDIPAEWKQKFRIISLEEVN